jgi:hypothetical protein
MGFNCEFALMQPWRKPPRNDEFPRLNVIAHYCLPGNPASLPVLTHQIYHNKREPDSIGSPSCIF